MFHDDAFGVAEALNETAFGTGLVARGQHYLTFGPAGKQSAVDRLLAQRKLVRPQYFFGKRRDVVSHAELRKTSVLQVSGRGRTVRLENAPFRPDAAPGAVVCVAVREAM